MRYINKQISQIKQKIKQIVAKDKDLSHQVQLLASIKGIGEKTAWAILAYLGDIRFFHSAKQVSSYAGLNPKIKQSGSCVNQSSLSKMGHKRLRKSLYMSAIVASKYNPLMFDLYVRLKKKGKPGKVALCAVMRKLLVIAYGVLKSQKLNRGN